MGKSIILPDRLSTVAICNVYADLVGDGGMPNGSDMVFDFSCLRWVDPEGIASLHHVLAWLIANNTNVIFCGMNISIDAHSYLDDAGFFKEYLGYYLSPSGDLRGSTFPVVRVEHSKSHAWLISSFIPWLCRELCLNPGQLATVQICIKEIFNSIKDHSSQTIGCIFAQHFPSKRKIDIAVSDFGVGIPATVRRVMPGLSDPDALARAVKYGVSSKSLSTNAGAGLDILLKNLVERNRGVVRIYSGCGVLRSKRSLDGMVTSVWRAVSCYPGTLIALTIKTDTFVPDEDEREDLVW